MKIYFPVLVLFLVLGCSSETGQSGQLPTNIDQVVESMTRPNDQPLRNAPDGVAWAERAIVVQGVPRGTATPDWWSTEINNKRYLSDVHGLVLSLGLPSSRQMMG
ncbi:hypothetical protein JCM19233_4243 [Vibrio astriarenae]|nr:hypothetical protein JCM19233_4243 [Vibrio sp. C7]